MTIREQWLTVVPGPNGIGKMTGKVDWAKVEKKYGNPHLKGKGKKVRRRKPKKQ
jgi:hypothetical protein